MEYCLYVCMYLHVSMCVCMYYVCIYVDIHRNMYTYLQLDKLINEELDTNRILENILISDDDELKESIDALFVSIYVFKSVHIHDDFVYS